MLVKKLIDCEEITAGDKTLLKDVLHPKNEGINFPFSVAYARVKPGKNSIKHMMKTTEVYYILRGSGIMHFNDETKEIMQDCAIYIPPMSYQYIENTGNVDLEFLCLVAPPWRQEDQIDPE